MFGLSLLNVRSRNNINVNFLLYPCASFFLLRPTIYVVVCFGLSIKLYAAHSFTRTRTPKNHHMKNRKSIYFGIVIKHATRYKRTWPSSSSLHACHPTDVSTVHRCNFPLYVLQIYSCHSEHTRLDEN